MRFCQLFIVIVITGCSTKPGRLNKLERKDLVIHHSDIEVVHTNSGINAEVNAVYLGCGGVYLVRNGDGILIDPFFSNQKIGRLGRSVLFGANGKTLIKSDPEMIAKGFEYMRRVPGQDSLHVIAILNSHSHYDHLMDIPAVYQQLKKKPLVLLNESGFNTCNSAIDNHNMLVLEDHASTNQDMNAPIEIRTGNSRVNIYPILADHNPHFRNIKFFSGSNSKPVTSYKDPYQKTKANLWLEGKTFSFLIDYLNEKDEVAYRVFIQSSSCNPPSGIPAPQFLLNKKVDLAFLGIASYSFSPDYPCTWLQQLEPAELVWIHWEDFFRKYTRDPKTVRGTDVPGFFDLACVKPYKKSSKMVLPGTKIKFVY